MILYETITMRAQKTNMFVKQLITLHKKLTMNLQFISLKIKKYYDKNRFEKINLKMRNKVYMLKKNIKTAKKITN